MLDVGLARALAAAGRDDEASSLKAAAQCGLRLTAAQVRCVAAAGPLPDIPPVAPPPSRPLAVRLPAALGAAQHRLAALITAADDLRPQHVEQIVTAQARCAVVTSRLVRDTQPRLAAELQRHARPLAAVVDGPQRVASIRPSDPRPLVQARELHRYLSQGIGEEGQVEAAVGFARDVPAVTTALLHQARRQNSLGRWLVPEPEHHAHRPIWTRTGPGRPEPAMLAPLAAAACADSVIGEVAGQATIGRTAAELVARHVPPRESLHVVLEADGRCRRPDAPEQRIGLATGRQDKVVTPPHRRT
jgi:hypothetical protein